MRLDAALIRLPYQFDAAAVGEALARLEPDAWLTGEPLDVLPLISPAGEATGEIRHGPMRPGEHLHAIPELATLANALGVVPGRFRMLRMHQAAKTPLRTDIDYYWHRRVRVAFVIGPGCRLHAGALSLDAPPGSVWLIDGWRGWRVEAGGEDNTLLAMLDTVGSAAFWSLADSADRPQTGSEPSRLSARTIRFDVDPDLPGSLETERIVMPKVVSAAELDELCRTVLGEIREAGATAMPRLEAAIDSFQRQWQAVQARFGDSEEGHQARRQTLEQAWSQIAQYAGAIELANGVNAAERFYRLVFEHALHDESGRPREVISHHGDSAGGTHRSAAASEAPLKAPASDYGESPQTIHNDSVTASAEQKAADPRTPLRSVHTRSFPELLRKTASSVLVTTYQAGKLAILREKGGVINTHFQVYNRPMGLAADQGRLAIGTASAVEEYRNMVDVAGKIDPPGSHDAAYLPRDIHVTGNIDIHEMAYGAGDLWVVNTRFSCLCTLDQANSFVPRWRPPFISGYAPEDRCHLNGLEMVNGQPKYVTALGETDTPGGWRDNKAGGGILMDVDSGEVICRGLSMPHSPRWYDGRLWVLESGNGSLATVEPDSGRVETIVELPGFTRGLDFYGPFAFVGLSQVRESAVFSGIRLTERVDERNCGVWVIDLRTARIVAFLKFEDAVQEVFAVTVLANQRYPDVLSVDNPLVPISYALPEEALAEVQRDDNTR